jgi:hypothetical protein
MTLPKRKRALHAAMDAENAERLPPQRSGGRQDALVVPDLGQPDDQKKT